METNKEMDKNLIYAIKDSVLNLEQLQKQIEQQKNFLKNIDITKPLSEKEWVYLCETPLNSDNEVLCALAQKIFPEGAHFRYKEAYIHFDLYGFECGLPTFNVPGVKIDLSWAVKPIDPQKEDIKSKKLINYVLPVLSRYTDNISNFYEYPRIEYAIKKVVETIRNEKDTVDKDNSDKQDMDEIELE